MYGTRIFFVDLTDALISLITRLDEKAEKPMLRNKTLPINIIGNILIYLCTLITLLFFIHYLNQQLLQYIHKLHYYELHRILIYDVL